MQKSIKNNWKKYIKLTFKRKICLKYCHYCFIFITIITLTLNILRWKRKIDALKFIEKYINLLRRRRNVFFFRGKDVFAFFSLKEAFIALGNTFHYLMYSQVMTFQKRRFNQENCFNFCIKFIQQLFILLLEKLLHKCLV